VKRSSSFRRRPILRGRSTDSDDPCASTARIAAIDVAHRQSRHHVLIDRAFRRRDSAQPMLKDTKKLLQTRLLPISA